MSTVNDIYKKHIKKYVRIMRLDHWIKQFFIVWIWDKR